MNNKGLLYSLLYFFQFNDEKAYLIKQIKELKAMPE